jgi:ammonium transporter
MVGFEGGETIDDCFATDYAHWFFQFSFAAAASTIVSGAIAERVKFQAYLLVAAVVTGFVYPVIARWMWYETGWLAEMGAIDFAGSGVVHLTGGTIGLMGALAVGYRNQFANNRTKNPPRFERIQGKWVQNDLPPSSEHLATLGTFLLSLGWIAFNVGSYGAVYSGSPFAGQDLGRIAANTVLSSASCAITCIVAGVLVSKRKARADPTAFVGASVDDALNGILAGLVAVTASCAVVTPGFALLTGVLAAGVYKGAEVLLLRLRIDDPLNAFPVHGACGTLGLIAVGLFANPVYVERLYDADTGGVVYGHGSLLGIQLLAAVVIALWAALFAGVIFMVMRRVDSGRVDTLFFIRTEESAQHVGFGSGGQARAGSVLGFVLPSTYLATTAEEPAGKASAVRSDDGSVELGPVSHVPHFAVASDANLLDDTGVIVGTGTASADVTLNGEEAWQQDKTDSSVIVKTELGGGAKNGKRSNREDRKSSKKGKSGKDKRK